MTVSTPSFVFPHSFENSRFGDHGHPPCDSSGQWQYGNGTERPRTDTGSSMYGNYVRPSLKCSNHFTDNQQSLDPAEVVCNASEKMLEHNGHFLQAKMVAEQRAIEIARLQGVVNAHARRTTT